MATFSAPDPLAELLRREQARLIDCIQRFADGDGAPAIGEARRILGALADAEAQVLYPALSRVSLRLESELLLESVRHERAHQLSALDVLAHKRAPRLRKLGALALADEIKRHGQQLGALLVPVLASQLPRPMHRAIVHAFIGHYEAALARRPRSSEPRRRPRAVATRP